ncbi:tRNA-uridine aminocarboxypropyltransferase 2 isoform 4-T9 [Amazona ochrocephala]
MEAGSVAAPATAPVLGEEGEGCAGLWELPVERCERRPECGRCSRPQKVCLCPFLPIHPLKVSACLYIIQHPAEESRVLRTVPLLAACLPPDKCKIVVGRRFSEDRYPELAAVCRSPNTLILYPGAEATNLEEIVVVSSSPSVMIIIDGTWSQAKDIFYKNPLFRLPKQFPCGQTGGKLWCGIENSSWRGEGPLAILEKKMCTSVNSQMQRKQLLYELHTRLSTCSLHGLTSMT